ncbi:TPA: hypothetical protein DDW69_04050 [candidate division CPR2 bacterium]|nr:MAG: hypothetical protein A2Y27_01870 [candidate division CPR2 bacterium GWD1_39_7]OGB71591.1 MAG: hypothetical protein A2Y26_04290 [candidate division CPR2 bacterium GWD2_39_7]HBG81981.1 hypothetical protein [candidate division CPR2 bacterium]
MVYRLEPYTKHYLQTGQCPSCLLRRSGYEGPGAKATEGHFSLFPKHKFKHKNKPLVKWLAICSSEGAKTGGPGEFCIELLLEWVDRFMRIFK